MDIDLNYDDLRDEAKTDSNTTVKNAVKRHLGALDRMVRAADDPDELVEHIDASTDHLISGRRNLRDHRPVAAIGGSSSSAPALSSGEQDVVDQIKAGFGGDLSKALDFLRQQAAIIGDLQREKDDLARELRDEKAAHQATKQSVAVDPQLTKERDDLKVENTRLKGEVNRLQGELAAEKAKKTPPTVTGDLAEANGMLDDVKTHMRPSRFGSGYVVDSDKLHQSTRDRIGMNGQS